MSDNETTVKTDTLAQSIAWCIAGGISGLLLGTVMSYWFQAGALRAFLSLGAYLQLISKYVTQNEISNIAAADIAGVVSTVEISAMAFGLVGGIGGGFLGEQRALAAYGPGTKKVFAGFFLRFTALVILFIASRFVLLSTINWFKVNSSMRALRPDGSLLPVDAPMFPPIMEFWRLAEYEPRWLFVVQFLPVAIIAVVLTWLLPLRRR